MRILVAAPVRQKPAILAEFLRGLDGLKLEGLQVSYLFVDDNDDAESSSLLQHFMAGRPGALLRLEERPNQYLRDEGTHRWNTALIQRVAKIKDFLLSRALKEGYDYVFLADSDLVLHPRTLQHLAGLQRDIVSEVFWTAWQAGEPMLPQTWLTDQYTMYWQGLGEKLSDVERQARTLQFLWAMRDGGCHQVGGLGACTMISRRALLAGVSFRQIPNVSFWGEDRAFCIRAAAIGLELCADTRLPPLHLYRESELSRVASFRRRCDADFDRNPKLTLSMVVRNEADRYLRRALQAHAGFIQEAVIIDDASTDGTVDLIRDVLANTPHVIYRLDRSLFSHEINLRRLQWERTLETNPDWILNLDADEILEDRAAAQLPRLLNHPGGRVAHFQLFDFWNETQYRDDASWVAHQRAWPLMIRYTPDFNYVWRETALHCGRFPVNINELPHLHTGLRVKHMGWARPQCRRQKYERYLAIDPEMKLCDAAQMQSILDESPRLVDWVETPGQPSASDAPDGSGLPSHAGSGVAVAA
jgi:hypothetical protein